MGKYMGLFSLEHSKRAYGADFAIYLLAVLSLALLLIGETPRAQWLSAAALTAAGFFGWSAIEYALHRFVLHGLRPFRTWHEAHHHRPHALICAPTVLSLGLIVGLVFAPALLLGDVWRACALTLGVGAGYLGYAVTHHATHHWRGEGAWLRRRKRWHALHHQRGHRVACYGVTSAIWDHVFGSTPLRPTQARRAP